MCIILGYIINSVACLHNKKNYHLLVYIGEICKFTDPKKLACCNPILLLKFFLTSVRSSVCYWRPSPKIRFIDFIFYGFSFQCHGFFTIPLFSIPTNFRPVPISKPIIILLFTNSLGGKRAFGGKPFSDE